MWFFKKKEKVWRIITIGDRSYEYPEDMPLPRVGESVTIEGKKGEVTDIRHSIRLPYKEVIIKTK